MSPAHVHAYIGAGFPRYSGHGLLSTTRASLLWFGAYRLDLFTLSHKTFSDVAETSHRAVSLLVDEQRLGLWMPLLHLKLSWVARPDRRVENRRLL